MGLGPNIWKSISTVRSWQEPTANVTLLLTKSAFRFWYYLISCLTHTHTHWNVRWHGELLISSIAHILYLTLICCGNVLTSCVLCFFLFSFSFYFYFFCNDLHPHPLYSYSQTPGSRSAIILVLLVAMQQHKQGVKCLATGQIGGSCRGRAGALAIYFPGPESSSWPGTEPGDCASISSGLDWYHRLSRKCTSVPVKVSLATQRTICFGTQVSPETSFWRRYRHKYKDVMPFVNNRINLGWGHLRIVLTFSSHVNSKQQKTSTDFQRHMSEALT